MCSVYKSTDLYLVRRFVLGFKKIEGLDDYTGLKSLWLDHNHFKTIGDGLSQMQNLTCLFLQNNSLSDLQGIESLQNLVILDVSSNQLEDTGLLGKNHKLFSFKVRKMKTHSCRSITATDDLVYRAQQVSGYTFYSVTSTVPEFKYSVSHA